MTPYGTSDLDALHFAERLFDALNSEFDGFPDDELLLTTSELMRDYGAWRKRPDVAALLASTRPTHITACPMCGGEGVMRYDAALTEGGT